MKQFVLNLINKIKARPLFYLLFFSFLIRLLYLFVYPRLWWDSHVYIGMAKYIFSLGQIGIWEAFRPLVHPIVLGLFWKIGFNPILTGRILDLFFSLASIYLVYFIGKKIFNEKIALISAIIFSITPLSIMFTGLILTEPLAIFLGLIGIYFLIKENIIINFFFAGIFLSLSFLTKFPQGLLFAGVIITLFFKKEKFLTKFKQFTLTSIGFIIPLIPYLIFNYYRYPNMWEPFISGSWIVTTATYLYGSGIHYYFINFFFANPFYIFFFPAIYYFFKYKQWHNKHFLLLTTIPLLIILYFLYVPRKEIRYLVIALPFLSLLISPTILKLIQKLTDSTYTKKTLKIAFNLSLIIPLTLIFFFSGVIAFFYYLFVALPVFIIILGTFLFILHKRMKAYSSQQIKRSIIIALTTIFILAPFIFSGVFTHFQNPTTLNKEYVNYVQENHLNGTIITTSPFLISYLDNKIVSLVSVEYAPPIYQQNKADYQLIIINTCDLPCPPTDQDCQNRRESFLSNLSQENKLDTHKTTIDFKNNTCQHYIYLPK